MFDISIVQFSLSSALPFSLSLVNIEAERVELLGLNDVSPSPHPAGIVRSFLRNLIRLLLWRPECLFGEPNEKEGPSEDHLESKWSESGEEEDIARLASHSPGSRRANRVQRHLTGECQGHSFNY